MLAVVLAVVAVDTFVLAMSPSAYLRRKIAGISSVAGAGILVNLVGVVIVALS